MRQIATFSFLVLLAQLVALLPATALASDAIEEGSSAPSTEASVQEDESESLPGGGAGLEGSIAIGETQAGFDYGVYGYLRSSLYYMDYDEAESDFIGRNQGFGLANVRLGLTGRRDRARFVVEADGAVAVMESANTASGRVTFGLADALAAYELVPGILEVQLGQQKVPFDGETLIPTSRFPFINPSVWARGVRGVEGFNVDGLAIGREVGLTLAGERIGIGSGPVAFSYALALTNGTSASEPLNENRSLALFGRVEAHFEDILTVGAAGFSNTRTFGALPDLLDERHLGLAADLTARLGGAWGRIDFVQRQVDYPDVAVESGRTSLGGGASLGYRTPCGFEGAYRIAYLDPTWKYDSAGPALSAQLEANELLHHTFGISWVPENHPLGVQLNYTHARENPERAISNDRVELLGRLVF